MARTKYTEVPTGAYRIADALERFVPEEIWEAYREAQRQHAEWQKTAPRPPDWLTDTSNFEERMDRYSAAMKQRPPPSEPRLQWKSITRELQRQVEDGELAVVTQESVPLGPWVILARPAPGGFRIRKLNNSTASINGSEARLVFLGRPKELRARTKQPQKLKPGQSGAPRKMSLVEDEIIRRQHEGEAYESHARESQHLRRWLEENHTDHAKLPSKKTVRDYLSKKFPKGRNKIK